MSALPPKADIGLVRRDVCFVPIADICSDMISIKSYVEYEGERACQFCVEDLERSRVAQKQGFVISLRTKSSERSRTFMKTCSAQGSLFLGIFTRLSKWLWFLKDVVSAAPRKQRK